jgi:flagellar biosynthetic protein FlhB
VAEDKHSKKHPASDKKKRDLKKKGTTVKSQDVPMAAGLLAAAGALYFMGDDFVRRFLETLTYCVQQIEVIGKTGELDYGPLLIYIMTQVAILSMPVLGAVLIIAVISNVAQSGFIFTGEQLKPNINKLNPTKKLKQWFSVRSLQDLAKSLAKILAAFVIGALAWKAAIPMIVESVAMSPEQLIAVAGTIISGIFWKILVLYIVVAIADYMFQRKNFSTEHKMTDKEVRDEYKNTEGDPYIKQKRRQMAQQVAYTQSQEHVPAGDVVVINPTELAIVLKYDPDVSPVPYVIAKGATRLADDIRSKAREHQIPVVRNKPLARALFDLCEIGDIVPEELFRPVAEVLAYVFALDERTADARAAAQAAQQAQAADPQADVPQQPVSPLPVPALQIPPPVQPLVHELPEIQVPTLQHPAASATAAGVESGSWQPIPHQHEPMPLADLPLYNWSNPSYLGGVTPPSHPANPWADPQTPPAGADLTRG